MCDISINSHLLFDWLCAQSEDAEAGLKRDKQERAEKRQCAANQYERYGKRKTLLNYAPACGFPCCQAADLSLTRQTLDLAIRKIFIIVFSTCNAGALGDERHLIFECTALASLRSRYAGLFTSSTDTMRSFFAQPDRMGVFHCVIDCLDFMKI